MARIGDMDCTDRREASAVAESGGDVVRGSSLRGSHNRSVAAAIGLSSLAALLMASLPVRADAPSEENLPAPRALSSAYGPLPPPPNRGARRGENPCMTADPGFGVYDRWQNISTGQMIAPQRGGITKACRFDLVVHFHGHEPVRKEFVKTATGQVLVGIDLGLGSGPYANAFADPSRFERVISSVEAAMAKRNKRDKCTVRKLALSSWSAGYGATWRILQQPAGRKVDAVILLDSLHGGYLPSGEVSDSMLEPFVAFARSAAARQKFMFLSHSSIQPPGYASTTEVARYLIRKVDPKAKERSARREDVLGLDMYARWDKGNFHVRGYSGDDKPDHCAHLGLMADVMKTHIQPRWQTPRGQARAASSR